MIFILLTYNVKEEKYDVLDIFTNSSHTYNRKIIKNKLKAVNYTLCLYIQTWFIHT